MAKYTNLIIKLLIVFFLFPIQPSFANLQKEPENYYTIPLEFIDNSPYITVTIENKKIKLILDTGASTALYLKKSVLNGLKNKKYTGRYDDSMDAQGRPQNNPYFVLKNVNTENYQIQQVEGIVYQPWGINNHSKHEDGMIGLKFFKNHNLILDYPKRRLIILKPGTMHPDYTHQHWNTAPLSTSKDILTCKATLDGKSYQFLLDTGSTGSVLKRAAMAKTRDQNTFFVKNFAISSKNFGPVQFWMMDLNDGYNRFDGLLGHDFFSSNVIFLDFHKHEIKIS